MPIPKDKKRKESRERQIRKLQRATTEENANIRRHLRRAREYAIQHDNGNAEATAEMQDHINLAIDSGLASDALRLGGGMVAKINAIIDRPESQNHAIGLLLNAADLLADFDADLAVTINDAAESIAGGDAEAIQQWRDISTPSRIVYQ